MKRLAAAVLVLVSIAAHGHSFEKADVQVRHPWSRATPPSATIGVAFMEIRNRGSAPDRLLSATSPVAARVELHVTRREGELVRMRPLEALEINARERLELRPGGAHLMLVELREPLKKGERVPMTLRFERAGELEIMVEVQELGSRHARH